MSLNDTPTDAKTAAVPMSPEDDPILLAIEALEAQVVDENPKPLIPEKQEETPAPIVRPEAPRTIRPDVRRDVRKEAPKEKPQEIRMKYSYRHVHAEFLRFRQRCTLLHVLHNPDSPTNQWTS